MKRTLSVRFVFDLSRSKNQSVQGRPDAVEKVPNVQFQASGISSAVHHHKSSRRGSTNAADCTNMPPDLFLAGFITRIYLRDTTVLGTRTALDLLTRPCRTECGRCAVPARRRPAPGASSAAHARSSQGRRELRRHSEEAERGRLHTAPWQAVGS